MTKRTIIIVACIAVVLANLTYLAGRFFHSSDIVYTGRDRVSGADKTVYISMIEEAKQDAFFFHNLYTSELQQPHFFQPLWLFLGRIAGLLHLPSLDVFELSRLIVGFFFSSMDWEYLQPSFPKKIMGASCIHHRRFFIGHWSTFSSYR